MATVKDTAVAALKGCIGVTGAGLQITGHAFDCIAGAAGVFQVTCIALSSVSKTLSDVAYDAVKMLPDPVAPVVHVDVSTTNDWIVVECDRKVLAIEYFPNDKTG